MLEIQEKNDSVGYEALAMRAPGAKLHITEALDRGEAIGYIAYSYEPEKTVVYAYDDGGDIMLCDGLVRSVMFKSVLKGIEHMLFSLDDEGGFEHLRKLRFISGDSCRCDDLSRFMDACEGCRKAEDKGGQK